ncbi:MAG TPA: GGDEF domain-containing protein [Solirubrobacteraceae bacterium]|nr:GGDEF domain-containing protein [Solirubrobacteraceae bacterium]
MVSTRVRSGLPFAVATALPLAVLALPGPGLHGAAAVAGVALSAVVALLFVLVPWGERPGWWALVPALAYLGAVALLREGAGGNASGIGPMALLPIVWIALYGSRRTLAVTVAGALTVYWLPILVEGGTRYPDSGWRIGAVLAVLGGVLGFAVLRLHGQVREQAERLERLAFLDELTGLPNRRGWDAALDTALAVAERRSEHVCVAQIDLDEFKRVNDSGGHAAGDRLLAQVAAAWQRLLRPGDVLARTGGDEFALLLVNCETEEGREVADRLRHAIPGTTCSMGLARWRPGEDGGEVVRRADGLLYQAKRQGRDRLCCEPAE